MRKALLGFFYVWALFFGGTALGAPAYPGYVDDVSAERAQKFYEIYIFASPPPKSKSLHETIFNQTLSKEFRDKYRDKFGQVDTESIVYQPTKFSILDENRGAVSSVETKNQERRDFAEYMLKRLTEYHVDNYFKNDPTMRPIYEAKQKLSNVQVKVADTVRLNIRYELAGNTLDLVAKNPWCDARVSFEMDPSAFGPSSMQETRLWFGKDLDKRNRINSNAAVNDGIVTLEYIHRLRSNLATIVSASTFFKDGDITVKQLDTLGAPTVRESRGFLGLSHSF